MSAVTELHAVDPRNGQQLGTVAATPLDDVATACSAAGGLFRSSGRVGADPQRIQLLRALADELEQARGELIGLLDAETALGETRLNGELSRTAFQLRAFADEANTDRLLQPLIDTADPERVPPRTDQRRLNVPLGPIAVFAASNFPLAFGVLGGDTASALAAGCPVVAKAHPAQPLSSARLADVASRAAGRTGVNTAWLQVVHGDGPEIGLVLVRHPDIAGVGFTGSFGGGAALVAAAAERPVPIPVHAEMGSVNPSFVAPYAAASRAAELGRSWADALTANAGQLCTKPGILVVPTEAAANIAEAAREQLAKAMVPPLLSARLKTGYENAVERVAAVSTRIDRNQPNAPSGAAVASAILEIDADVLRTRPEAVEEMFGPAGVVVSCPSEEILIIAEGLPGSLATAVMADPEDSDWVSALLPVVSRRVGRVVYNAWPTGVSVGWGTVHGGPWPATSNAAATSVGLTAAWRWSRPVAFERFPAALLPEPIARS